MSGWVDGETAMNRGKSVSVAAMLAGVLVLGCSPLFLASAKGGNLRSRKPQTRTADERGTFQIG
jgi:hypothetical protein